MEFDHSLMPVITTGKELNEADSAMILLHGRYSNSSDILSLAQFIHSPGMHFMAPQAAGGSWYPFSFMDPEQANQPGLDNALSVISSLVNKIAEAGIPQEKTYLLGFSQGACLALEFAARNGNKYGGVFGLSGGLIGDKPDTSKYSGHFGGSPVFLGCSVRDSHIPAARVKEAAWYFEKAGATVNMKLYKDLGHEISKNELDIVNTIILNNGQI
ncbi:MAG: dienelactone hydrolase family protein [Ignavibacteriales bacterium]|nr:dienelactone hydrolase family protein [Ignavibacteriales bacterium]MCF8315636.1 dienelactone hydrolase family protein [Ignavibacteriales bacterium]MCF8437170.1 dienelactone hydrolase family protein [Ignavibacteriales bacterium]